MSNARESKKETGKGGKILVTSNEGKSKKEKGKGKNGARSSKAKTTSTERRRTGRRKILKVAIFNLSLLFAEVSLL